MRKTSILTGLLALLTGSLQLTNAMAEGKATAPALDPKKACVYTPTVPADERGIYGDRIGKTEADT